MKKENVLEAVAGFTVTAAIFAGFPTGAWMTIIHGEVVRGLALLIMGVSVAYIATAIAVIAALWISKLDRTARARKEAARKLRYARRCAAEHRAAEFSAVARRYQKN